MKEELTTSMHKELTISKSNELKLKVWTLLTLLDGNIQHEDFNAYLEIYDLEKEDIDTFYNSWVIAKNK